MWVCKDNNTGERMITKYDILWVIKGHYFVPGNKKYWNRHTLQKDVRLLALYLSNKFIAFIDKYNNKLRSNALKYKAEWWLKHSYPHNIYRLYNNSKHCYKACDYVNDLGEYPVYQVIGGIKIDTVNQILHCTKCPSKVNLYCPNVTITNETTPIKKVLFDEQQTNEVNKLITQTIKHISEKEAKEIAFYSDNNVDSIRFKRVIENLLNLNRKLKE